jgi:hypothetical protein
LETGTPKIEKQFFLDLDDLRSEIKKNGLSDASVKLVSDQVWVRCILDSAHTVADIKSNRGHRYSRK